MRPPPSDPPEIEGILWAGWQGRLAWDVGANLGQSLWHLTAAFGRTWAFEPAAESFKALSDEWGQHPRVVLNLLAVAGHDGNLLTAVRQKSIAHGELVLLADMPEQDQGLPATEALPWGTLTGKREVACYTCDTICGQIGLPDFIKVDTEGHEAQVLHGAPKILAEGKTGWLIEFHGVAQYAECVSLLEGAGYEPETIRHPHYAPDSRMWTNHGWIRAEAPCHT